MHIKYPRAKPFFSKQDRKTILAQAEEILTSGMLTQGKYVQNFEAKFAAKVGCQYAVATNSCTSALEIAIRSLGIQEKTILVPSQTFVASVNSIIMSGNTPMILDIDQNTMCLSAGQVIDKLNDDVGAVLWVHMAGMVSPDILRIKSECESRGIFIIEDAAHAHGASSDGISAGNLGHVGCFSFYPTKVMATGEGGMITTNDKHVFDIASILRSHGAVRNPESIAGLDYGVEAKYASQNFRMTEMSAIMGLTQLEHLDHFVNRRNHIADLYSQQLKQHDEITLFPKLNNTVHSYWNFYFMLNGIDREQFAKSLLYNYGIQTANAYDPPCHEQTLYKDFIISEGYPIANNVLKRHISLPMYFELTDDDIRYITNSVGEVITNLQ